MKRIKKHKNIRDTYVKYLEITDKEDKVDIKTYADINKLYFKFLINEATKGNTVTLPSRMGVLSVQGKKVEYKVEEDGSIKGLAPDWKRTKEYWLQNEEAKKNKKLLYCMNIATDGIRYKWFWSKSKVLVTNKSLYTLIMTRENKRKVHKIVSDTNNKNNFIVKI